MRDPDHINMLMDVLPGRVVYKTNRRNKVDFDVVVHTLAGGGRRAIVNRGAAPRALTGADEHAVYAHATWTPDGDALVVTTNRGRDLAAIDPQAPNPRPCAGSLTRDAAA